MRSFVEGRGASCVESGYPILIMAKKAVRVNVCAQVSSPEGDSGSDCLLTPHLRAGMVSGVASRLRVGKGRIMRAFLITLLCIEGFHGSPALAMTQRTFTSLARLSVV